MKLPYKEFIINQFTNYARGSDVYTEFWRNVYIHYMYELTGIKEESWSACYYALESLPDENYCGMGINPRAQWYLYDIDAATYYWFVSANDAIFFSANVVDIRKASAYIRPQDNFNNDRFFLAHCRKIHDGYLWMSADDIDSIQDILTMPPLIKCISRDVSFNSIDEAARWLMDNGKGANLKTVYRALERCLSGETNTCYGFLWTRE